MSDEIEIIVVGSGYGHKSREPFVQVRIRDEEVQLTPEIAQEIASNMMMAAEAALSDAFLIEWVMEDVNIPIKDAAKLLGEFRIWRGKRRDEKE